MKLKVLNNNDYIQFVSLFSFGCTQDNPSSHIFSNYPVGFLTVFIVDMYRLE